MGILMNDIRPIQFKLQNIRQNIFKIVDFLALICLSRSD